MFIIFLRDSQIEINWHKMRFNFLIGWSDEIKNGVNISLLLAIFIMLAIVVKYFRVRYYNSVFKIIVFSIHGRVGKK